MFLDGTGYEGSGGRGGKVALLRRISSGDQSSVGSVVESVAKHVPVNTTPPDSLSAVRGLRGIMTTIFIGEILII